MIPAPTPPSGESAPPSLPTETILEAELRHHADTIASNGEPSVMYEHLDQAADELARLRAEVARLTAEREDHGPDGRNVTNAQHLAMRERAQDAEARAARAEDALGEWLAALDLLRVTDIDAPEWDAVEVRHNAAVEEARRALTEGADRHA